ncbi:MAG: hypothetical protein ACTSX6_10440 [Candidatus Heimdallarchaeaceae archaeon]
MNVAVTGEPGIGKSYLAMDFARVLDPKFTIDQVVFNFAQFMELVLRLPMGRPIVFDEPSYAMGKRDWYKELNKALVLTIESFRFKVHPLFIPIINTNLLDRTVRQYLIQYLVHVIDRGFARVYRLFPSQWKDEYYHYHLCNVRYEIFDRDKCNKETCLGCKKLKSCQIFRAQYERKKAAIQDTRYARTAQEIRAKESMLLTDKEIESLLYKHKDKFTKNGKIDVDLLRIVAEEEEGLKIGHNRAYRIKKRLELHHRNEFS